MRDLNLYKDTPKDKLPKVWFPFYVVYRYKWCTSTFIVGFLDDTVADAFQKELLIKKDIIRCEIFGHYPLELLK